MDLIPLYLALSTLGAAAAILLFRNAASAERRPFERLMELVQGSERGARAAEGPAEAAPARLPFADALESLAQRVSPAETRRQLLRRLESAGWDAKMTPAAFFGLRMAAFAGGPLLGALTYALVVPSTGYQLPAAIAVALLTAAMPDMRLRDAIQLRQQQIRKDLPDLLDLLVMSVEAGLGFDAAVSRASRKMEGPLVDEIKKLLRDMQLGLTRGDAMRAMARRCQVREVSSFVAAICQAEQLGGSIATALRVQSRAIRMRYSQTLRERAAKLPIKMLIPLVLFIFPATFVILLGPGILTMIEALGGL